jgi:hypothetical protein
MALYGSTLVPTHTGPPQVDGWSSTAAERAPKQVFRMRAGDKAHHTTEPTFSPVSTADDGYDAGSKETPYGKDDDVDNTDSDRDRDHDHDQSKKRRGCLGRVMGSNWTRAAIYFIELCKWSYRLFFLVAALFALMDTSFVTVTMTMISFYTMAGLDLVYVLYSLLAACTGVADKVLNIRRLSYSSSQFFLSISIASIATHIVYHLANEGMNTNCSDFLNAELGDGYILCGNEVYAKFWLMQVLIVLLWIYGSSQLMLVFEVEKPLM